MQKTYAPHEIEKKIYRRWEKEGYFKPSGHGHPYCIMLPPPNVTGSLHMGHGFQQTIMDALIRYHRMKGFNTLWQPGTDHAGIATQMVVERQLLQKNISRIDIGREKFVEKAWEWKNQSGDTIYNQMRRLGTSPDWSRAAFTMDNRLTEATMDAFIQLHDEGLIYRGKRLVNWDPKLHTAISDLEVTNEEENGYLWYIQYPLADSKQAVVIATTRPETMLGDTAVAIHPDDKRFNHLIGKKIKLPLTNREIPIIADTYVEPEFGTGCVKITPAHDFNDYAIGQRHQLPMINILTFDAKINETAPSQYQGMDRFVARRKIVDDLNALGLLDKIEDYKIKVPKGDRSKAIIEPWLTNQWFVKTKPLVKSAIEVVESGKIKFVPETWLKTYYQWMNNIEDWCISRQLWWGHRIPAWYDDEGNIFVGKNEQEVRKKFNLSSATILKQDEDVLDTWFSSALWPFSTLGWPEETKDLSIFFPTNVLVTGFDIIFFWVARMIMFSQKFMKQIPFEKVYIHGLIRDPEGQKMSKSKGNVLDPIDLIDGIDIESLVNKRISGLMQPEMAKKIEKNTRKQFPNGIQSYGTDALRMTFCSLATLSRDISFDFGRLEGYRNFCNKLWNATRYIQQKVDSKLSESTSIQFNDIDKWILSKLQKTILKSQEYYDNYRFDLLTQDLYEFTWHEFCDWYLELSKPILNSDNYTNNQKYATQYTLITVFETILRLLHPLMPFVTEELWQQILTLTNINEPSIMVCPYPEFNKSLINKNSENEINWIKNVILSIRNIRGEMNVPSNKKITVYLNKGDNLDKTFFEKHNIFLMNLAKLEKIDWLSENTTPPSSATALIGGMEILIPLEGLIDMEAETNRLQKEIEKLNKDFEIINNKLSNKAFLEKAPNNIVKKEQKRLAEIVESKTQYELKLKSLN